MKTSTDDAISHPASSSTDPLVAGLTDKARENEDLKDRLWEDDDISDDDEDEEEEEENPVLKSACETASSTGMEVEVDDGVVIGVPQLRDYLSDFPAMSPLVDVKEGLRATKKATSLSAPRVFEVQDMTF